MLAAIRRVFAHIVFLGPLVFLAPFWAVASMRPWVSEQIVRSLERAGATFIKLGQIMSSRPDLIAPELCDALSRLQDQAPAHSIQRTRQIIENAFGKPTHELFREIDHEPIASGSIAQVHKAVLPDGRAVAVKVRHPNLERTVGIDVAMIEGLAALFGSLPTIKWLDPAGSARNFGETIRGQLDLVNEIENLKQFRANFAGNTEVSFPEPIDGMVAPTVLVESFEEGRSMNTILNSEYPNKKQLARQGLNAFMQMIFRDGFIHADLHPGNVLVRLDENDQPHTVIIDTGMVANLSQKDRENYSGFFMAISQYDARLAAKLMIDNAPLHDCRDPEGFGGGLEAIFDKVRDVPITEVEVARILSQVMQLVRKHRIMLEPAFTSVNVGIMVLEGVGRQLDPALNILEVAGPMLMQYSMQASSA